MDQSNQSMGRFISRTISFLGQWFGFIVIIALDLVLAFFAFKLFQMGYTPLGIVFVLIIAIISVAFFVPKAHMFKWMAFGLAAWLLFSIFPIFYTVYNGFTNYGDGHLITKEQAIQQIERETYLPEDSRSFVKWIAYKSTSNDYILWLKDDADQTMMARMMESSEAEKTFAVETGKNGIGEIDAEGAPVSIEGYQKLGSIAASTDKNLTTYRFGEPEAPIFIQPDLRVGQFSQLYVYDSAENTFTNQKTGVVYFDKQGTWTSRTNQKLIPGYTAGVGFANFVQFIKSPGLRGPLATIVAWNFAFATLSLLLTFSVGLLISIIYSGPKIKGKKLLRTLLIIPYTIPSLITILIWRAMFNQEMGIINKMLLEVLGIAPKWYTNPWLARAALLIVNTWLGYPYWMLVTSGALQGIPADVYEAAQIDGANGWQRFTKITLPLLLISVGPLMIASFIFNFNNFNLIYAFIGGGPPIPTATTTAGYTDIIISYVYNLAFASGRGAQYGYASAISLVLFILIAFMSLIQFRFTKMWEETSENV